MQTNSRNALFLGDYKGKEEKNPNAMEGKAEGIIFKVAQISFFPPLVVLCKGQVFEKLSWCRAIFWAYGKACLVDKICTV